MAEKIKRVGPPKAAGLEGNVFTWSVPLNAKPSGIWMVAFRNPRESSTICHPGSVVISEREMALGFQSSEGHVHDWVRFIDRWIDDANAAEAQALERMSKDQAAADQARKEKESKIREATEKFKSL